MNRLFFLLLIVFAPCLAYAQKTIKGLVENGSTGSPLPYANVFLKLNNKVGTITNSKGQFTLNIPSSSDSLIVSFIGFQRTAIYVPDIKSEVLKVSLQEVPNVLGEVIVMPDDTLRRLLRRAYERISVNYSQEGTLINGFYRETNQLIPENKILYYAESLIEFYKPTYNNEKYGLVKIIEGGKAELPDREKYSNIYFYAGPYAPQRFDFVKEKQEFINPKHYERYSYSITSTTLNEGRQLYTIEFKPKHNASYEGKFYLDVKTLAYVGADYKASAYGLSRSNSGRLPNAAKYRESNYSVKYRFINGLWQLSVVLADGTFYNPMKKNTLRYTGEYVSTSFVEMPDSPIKESEAILYSGVYTGQNEKFNDAFWTKPEIVSRTAEMEQAVDLIFKRGDLKLDESSSGRVKNSKINVITRIAVNLTTSFSLGYAPISSSGGLFSVGYKNYFHLNQTTAPRSYIPVIEVDLKYGITRSLAVGYLVSGNLNAKTNFSIEAIGVQYSKNIAGWKHPLLLQPALYVYYAKSSTPLGETTLNDSFRLNNKTIDSKTVSLAEGEIRYGLMPALQLSYKITPKLSLFGRVSSSVLSQSHNRIFLKEENGFFLFRKSLNMNPSTDGLTLQQNNVPAGSDTHFEDLKLFANIGLKLGFR